MSECSACGANIRPGMKICPTCKAPIQRGNQPYRDQRHGYCEYNDHGLLCDKPGSIALHTGEGGPWYCSEHALGLKGMSQKKIGTQSIKEHIESANEKILERQAIQDEVTGGI